MNHECNSKKETACNRLRTDTYVCTQATSATVVFSFDVINLVKLTDLMLVDNLYEVGKIHNLCILYTLGY